ncbi:hypothetical protein KEM54_000653, partial [Ascosphaera aggregata]
FNILNNNIHKSLANNHTSSLNAVLLCTIASMSPHLAHLVPDVSDLQQLVIDGASAWAVPESGSEAGVWIVADIGRRQRYCSST